MADPDYPHNCRTEWNLSQADVDDDDSGDACDNCVFLHNRSQSDLDTDFEGDRCDLDDGVIYIDFSQPGFVEWQEEVGFDSWNWYKGDLEVLSTTGVYTQIEGSMSDRECDLADPWVADLDPPVGTTVFFLATGNNMQGESGLGTDGDGQPRPNTNPCP